MGNFGKRLRVQRKIRGWSQEDLARKIGVSLSTVQRWETKRSRPIRMARRELGRLFPDIDIDN